MQIFCADFFSADYGVKCRFFVQIFSLQTELDYGVKCIGPKCIRETKFSVIKTWSRGLELTRQITINSR